MVVTGPGGPESPPAELEAEVQRIGRELAASFPSPARHPLRSLDQKAMQLTSQDARAGGGAVPARRCDPRLPRPSTT